MSLSGAGSHYEKLLARLTGKTKVTIDSMRTVGGGSINTCYEIQSSAGRYFLKENSSAEFPGMFEAEKRGLELLAEKKLFAIPFVHGIEENKGRSYLLMEWLERKSAGNSWEEAGKKLAKLHCHSSLHFGLDHANYLGSLPQENTPFDSWSEFFANCRILPQIRMARNSGKIDPDLVSRAENFCAKADDIFPPEKPALLHGDLWSGNFFFSVKGPALFDPAVYYGHHEMDLAMTKLFGGFEADFYAGYVKEFPPEKNWEQRVSYCNLYPLLVHVNLFGGGYVNDVKTILRAF
ncbi:MAG TPA: fructosamine kinase family protein [Bacteroidia bacterium]|nr:fructosamine kinase family protein [Bacteroidia bacterium]